MKILKIHLLEIVIVILFIVLAFSFSLKDWRMKQAVRDDSYNEGWTVAIGQEIREYDTLPEELHVSEEYQEIILRKQFSEDIDFVNAIGFYTSHQLVEVYIGGEKVYECVPPQNSRSGTPGNCWNFVQLWKGYSGKDLEIHIKNCYRSKRVKVPEFVYGSQSAIVINLIREKFLSLLISFIILSMGLVLTVGWFAFGKKMHLHKGIPWLGLFAVHFAVWSAFETQIPMIMFGRTLLCNQIDIIALKLMPVPIIYFMQMMYAKDNSRLFGALAVASETEFAVSLAGQALGLFDLKQTLWITHILGGAVAVTAIVLGVRLVVEKGKQGFQSQGKLWKNAVCIGIVGVCIILDAINYYYGFYEDVACFSRMGCLFYVLVLTKQFLNDSIKLIQAGEKAEALREEAALDGLTLLKNRRSFELDLHQIHQGDFRKYSVAMFDLNNLKRMNDVYGHGMGDCYIITGSEIIRDMFGDLGEVYRIGGDEFCLLSDSMTQEIFEEREKQMCDWLASLQGTQVKDFMQIASGFAKYNRSIDMNLQETLGRADERMYQCKRAQKAAQENGVRI